MAFDRLNDSGQIGFDLVAAIQAVRQDRDVGIRENVLTKGFVHRDRGCQNARANISAVVDLKKTLDGAVFSEGAVEYRENDVERSNFH